MQGREWQEGGRREQDGEEQGDGWGGIGTMKGKWMDGEGRRNGDGWVDGEGRRESERNREMDG